MKISRLKLTLTLAAAALTALVALGVVRASSWRERRWDTLELALSDNPTTLDPALIKDVAGGRLAVLLYPNLLKYSVLDTVDHDAALSWTVSSDAVEYTFTLRPGMVFNDNSTLDSWDVAASFLRVLSPMVASPRAWVLLPIKGAAAYHEGRADSVEGIECLDSLTLRLTLEKPSATFPALLTMPAAAILPAETPKKPFWGVETLPVAGGPFRVESLAPDIAVTLAANPTYFGDKPQVARVRYRVIRNSFAMVTEFRQGRLDVIDVPDAFDSFFRDDPERSSMLLSVEGQNTFYLGFNCTRKPFDSRDFRRAVSACIDRQALIDGVLRGRATPAAGPIPPGLSGYDPRLVGIPFDRENAQNELKRLGNGGKPLSLLVLSNVDSIVVAQALAGQLAAAGLQVEVAPRERGTFKSLLTAGDFDMVYYSWVADYADGENFLVPLFATAADRSGGNYTAYSNPDIDETLARAAATPGESERAALYREASAKIVSDAPRAFLWHSRRIVARQTWVRGFQLQHVYNAQRFSGVSIERP